MYSVWTSLSYIVITNKDIMFSVVLVSLFVYLLATLRTKL